MKLLDTLSDSEKTIILSGGLSTMFNTIFNSEDDELYDEAFNLCLNYYFSHSGLKTITGVYKRLIETNPNANSIMGEMIRNKFISKWKHIYSALNSTYNPLNDHDIEKHFTADNSINTTYDITVEDNGDNSVKQITTVNKQQDNEVFAFNSSVAQGESSVTHTDTETFEAKPEDNTTHNINNKTGTDTKDFDNDETENYSGRKTSGAELIEKEILLRNKQNLYNIIFNDIDSIATLKIYI